MGENWGYYVLGFILIAIGVFVYLKWDTLFGTNKSTPYSGGLINAGPSTTTLSPNLH